MTRVDGVTNVVQVSELVAEAGLSNHEGVARQVIFGIVVYYATAVSELHSSPMLRAPAAVFGSMSVHLYIENKNHAFYTCTMRTKTFQCRFPLSLITELAKIDKLQRGAGASQVLDFQLHRS